MPVLRKIVAAVVALSVASCIVGCGRASDIDELTYDKAQEAIAVGNDYLSGKIYGEEAVDELDRIHAEVNGHKSLSEHDSKRVLVSADILIMELAINHDSPEEAEEEVREYVDRLDELCHSVLS